MVYKQGYIIIYIYICVCVCGLVSCTIPYICNVSYLCVQLWPTLPACSAEVSGQHGSVMDVS